MRQGSAWRTNSSVHVSQISCVTLPLTVQPDSLSPYGAFHFHAWIMLLRNESRCYALLEHNPQQFVVDVAFKGTIGKVPVYDSTVCRRIQGIESAFAYRRSIREEVGHAIRVHAGHPF